MEAAVAQARKAQTRAVSRSFKDPDNYENLQFFYHPDHLGSSSFITNLDGEVVQHIEYVPFGEVFIEERNNIWNTPYLFNAKEFDEETGMYYYGARYYDPRLSLWMSTDPMQEKYPNTSGCNYANQNPIVFVDVIGLYPRHILTRHTTSWYKSDYYTFTPAVVHLLSLVSCVDKSHIAEAKIYERNISHPYPWYGGESCKVVSVLQHSMEKQMINLKPCTIYKVENHSNGDRGYGCFTFKTDSRGKPLADTYKELNTVRDVVSHENETNH